MAQGIKIAVFTTLTLLISCTTAAGISENQDILADLDPVSLGTTEAFFNRMFKSELKNDKIAVTFHPRENIVELAFKTDIMNHRQYWNQDARQLFIESLNQYNIDFNEKNLVLKTRKSKAAYGKFKAYAEWNSFKFTTKFKASPKYELGYGFAGQNVYFTVTQNPAREKSSSNDKPNKKSNRIVIYFTRAQGEKLAQLFDQDYLHEVAGINPAQ